MPKKDNNRTLSRIFTRNNLILIEYLLTKEDVQIHSLTELAEILGISSSSLSINCKKLLNCGILIEKNYRTDKSWAKLLEIDEKNELVRYLMKSFKALLTYENV